MREFIVYCLICLCCLLLSANAQQQEYRFEHISVNQGLSQSSVNSIIQDKYGFLWLATFDGLNQYDGYSFKVYKRKEGDSTSLFNNQVSKLLLTPDKSLWVGTVGCISRYNSENDNFVNYPIQVDGKSFPEAKVQDMFYLSPDKLMVSTYFGIYEFSIKNGKYSIPSELRFLQKEGVFGYFQSEKVGTWILLFSKILHKKTKDLQWSELKSPPINNGMFVPETDELFIRSLNKFLKYNLQTEKLDVIDSYPSHSGELAPILKLSNGKIWLGIGGIRIYDANYKFEKCLTSSKELPFSLSGDAIISLFETKDGIVWVGTSGFGLNKYDPQTSRFSYLGAFPGASLSLSNNYVDAIYTEDDNLIYVATIDAIDVFNLKENTSKHYKIPGGGIENGRVSCFYRNSKNILCMGTSHGVFEIYQNEIRRTTHPMLSSTDVYSVVNSPSGELLISTSKGVVHFEKEKEKIYKPMPGGPFIVMGDSIWVGDPNKALIYVLSKQSGKMITEFVHSTNNKFGLPAGGIKCFYKDSMGNIWVGSNGGGLSMYEQPTGNFIRYSEKDGIPNAVVYGILEDENKNLWISTNKGLSQFNIVAKNVRNYDVDDGLQSNEFDTRAYFKSPSGIMYFGGINGVSYFNPQKISTVNYIPQSVITRYYINNRMLNEISNRIEYDSSKKCNVLTLEADERDFGFEVAGLGFSVPGRTRYKYILENYNKQWNDIGNLRNINFTNIPSGSYTLRVKSSNARGDWEDKGVRLIVIVKTPLWKNTWVITLMSVALISLLFGVYYLRLYRLRKNAMLLSSIVEKRTKEIQQQKEEIARQNEMLIAQSDVLEERNSELERIKQLLEIRVEERTSDLKKMNTDLVNQNNKLEQFTFITAHNIRGPIARIKGLIKLMISGLSGDQVMPHLDKSVDDLDIVISDLTSILNIRSGIERSTELLNLREILNDAIALVGEFMMKEKAIINVDGFYNVSVKGVKMYFASIFYNLLHNALKYSSRERQTIIDCTCVSVNNLIVIEIKDNGIGIDMRYAENKIFNLYQRFHTEVNGKGFGLFLVKTQVEAMNGTITVTSELEKGTTFRMEFTTLRQ